MKFVRVSNTWMDNGLSIESPLVRAKPVDWPNGMTSRPPLTKNGNRNGSPMVMLARSTVIRSAATPAAPAPARPARLAGREQWVLAGIEAENEAAGQPLADLDVEVQLGRVQEDGVRDQPGEILASPGNHLDRPAQRQEFVDPRTDLGAANDRPRRILLGRPGLLEV